MMATVLQAYFPHDIDRANDFGCFQARATIEVVTMTLRPCQVGNTALQLVSLAARVLQRHVTERACLYTRSPTKRWGLFRVLMVSYCRSG